MLWTDQAFLQQDDLNTSDFPPTDQLRTECHYRPAHGGLHRRGPRSRPGCRREAPLEIDVLSIPRHRDDSSTYDIEGLLLSHRLDDLLVPMAWSGSVAWLVGHIRVWGWITGLTELIHGLAWSCFSKYTTCTYVEGIADDDGGAYGRDLG